MELDTNKGVYLVKLARLAIDTYLNEENKIERLDVPEWTEDNMGVFVTLKYFSKDKGNALRGCIGYPEPIMPLWDAVVSSALAAALEDPRFTPVKIEEFKTILVEVSVLTKPERLYVKDRKEIVNSIVIGKHGLIISRRGYKGLLLPQVAIEEEWDAEDFLCHTCLKAGLPPDCWFDRETEIYSFSARIFKEITPGGKIVEEELT